MALRKLTDIYLAALNKNGLEAQLTETGYIKFSYEGRVHLIIFDDDDPLYISVIAPWLYEIESESERYAVFRICNQLTAQHQYVKFFVGEQRVDVTVEQFRPEHSENFEFIMLCITFLNRAIDDFLGHKETIRGERQ